MHLFDGESSIGSLAHKLERHVRGRLWLQVLVALALGLSMGIAMGPDANLLPPEQARNIAQWIALPGEIFLRLIKMVLVPLVFFSIIRGLGGADIKHLRKIGPQFLVYLLCTTALSCLIGIGLASLLHPGSYVHITTDTVLPANGMTGMNHREIIQKLPDAVVALIPDNPLAAAIEGEMLSIVVFSLLFGIALAMQPNRRIGHMLSLLDDLLSIFMTIIKWAMFLAPIAVFGLTVRMAAETGISVLLGMGMFVATVLLGLLILLILYYGIVAIFGHRNPRTFARDIAGVQLLAFSTSSSAAVMPVSIKTAEEILHTDRSTSEIIVPLGTTINMDGTAVYQATAIIFLAQTAGMQLGIGQMALIVITLIASAIGSPGTPGVGVAILSAVAVNLGIPTTAYGLILGVDRILDMCRTAVNVTGDLTACVIFGSKKK